MGFRAELDQEPISNLQLRDAILVYPETVVRAAVALMRSHELGCAVIVENTFPHSVPRGVFTEKSLVDALMANVSLDSRTVGEFADSNFLAVREDEPISRVWNAVQRDGLRFVCVTDRSGKVIGITGQRGLSEYLAESFPQQVVVQRLGSKPWMQQREGA